MFRKGAASFLLLPMVLSGLAMVCDAPESFTEETDLAAMVSEGVPGRCDGKMCRMMSMIAGPEPVCVLSSSGAGIVVFELGLAVGCPSGEVGFQLPIIREPLSELVSLYSPPPLSKRTPPPKT